VSLVYAGMALDPDNTRAGVAKGPLLGVGPMPPPTPQDIALARLHRALDGAFQQPWNTNLPPHATPLENSGPVQGATSPILFGGFDKYLQPH
jgi:hypothetical protein